LRPEALGQAFSQDVKFLALVPLFQWVSKQLLNEDKKTSQLNRWEVVYIKA